MDSSHKKNLMDKHLGIEVEQEIAGEMMKVVLPMLLTAVVLGCIGLYVFIHSVQTGWEISSIPFVLGCIGAFSVWNAFRQKKVLSAVKLYVLTLICLVISGSLAQGTFIVPSALMMPIAIFVITILFSSVRNAVIIQVGIICYFVLIIILNTHGLLLDRTNSNPLSSRLIGYLVNLLMILSVVYFPIKILKRLYSEATERNLQLEETIRDLEESRIMEQTLLEKKEKLQEQLHQSQKMEAIGQLAGGVAHDFNNALGGIMGASDVIREGNLSPEVQREYLDMIITASERAADLTKKLLTFSRKGSKASTAVDCYKIINDTVGLLKHTINKNITVSVENRSQYCSIIGDDSLLQNAFMNMGINASHAMPDGGQLVFTLENVSLDAEYCATSPFNLNPGEYLEISIRDTGTGMSPEIVSRIFEPFFTTKEEGKGTGLGMAAVYGTVQEHGGAITVYSEVGVGTVFHLYLPVSDEVVVEQFEEAPTQMGSGTILIIDDEELIRITASAMLKSMGYTVIFATNGREGVSTFEEIHDQVDLIILDMIMPVMGGKEAFKKLREIDANVPIVISSGFAKVDDMAELKQLNVTGFLNKPFRKKELVELTAKIFG